MTFQDVARFCLDWQNCHTENMEGADKAGTHAHKGSVKRKRNRTNQWLDQPETNSKQANPWERETKLKTESDWGESIGHNNELCGPSPHHIQRSLVYSGDNGSMAFSAKTQTRNGLQYAPLGSNCEKKKHALYLQKKNRKGKVNALRKHKIIFRTFHDGKKIRVSTEINLLAPT